ncbi:natural cytotoxicity triggering receptor 3 ligand 1 [Rhineura floridana]|uniref:natural cytotoxicity triggering receptor 3 ligand 1 n=1 Tax=Rhineura floridana TaxID=261503 RepID=UPI002AC87B9E|nr:natural cytotoxicity triggering receptor 3 ligand 1 [Rhineura floridana]
MQGGDGLTVSRGLLLGLLVCLCGVLQPAETLKVTTRSLMTVALDTDVMIPCDISEYSTPQLDITKTAVEWHWKTSVEETEKIVYSVVSRVHWSSRNNVRMDENNLKKGNAALFLPQIQLSEGGTYRCFVIVTPDQAEGVTVIELFAEPAVNLSPREVTIEKDKERTLSCTVNKFYPGLIEVNWEKKSIYTSDKIVSAEDICMGSSVKNGDGTFSVTSKLRLQPSSQDNGNIYHCIVKHKSFSMQVFNATLIVTDPPANLNGLVVLPVLLLLGVIAGIVYITYFQKLPPAIVTIFGNKELKHLEEAQMVFLFSGFRPKTLEVAFLLKTKICSERQKIFSWNSKAAGNPEQGEEILPLFTRQGEENFHLLKTFYPTLKETQRRTFDTRCKICIVPDVRKLDEFELTLEVRHEALPCRFVTATQLFKVIAAPSLDKVQCSTDVPNPEEQLTLSCRIHSFFPEMIDVKWYKNDDAVSEKPILSEPKKDRDGLFFCSSSIKYCPQVSDRGKIFVCKANICGSPLCKVSFWEMKTIVFTPKVSKIKCEPAAPECGKPVTLSCLVKDFYPPECDICWRKDFEELIYAGNEAEDPQLDPISKLYSRKSQVSFIPKPEDHAVDFIVEINHCNKTLRFRYPLLLKGFPKVKDIILEPNDPEYGNSLSLTCEVMDFYPSDIESQWLDGDNTVKTDVDTKGPLEDSNGCFKLFSEYRLKPTALDYDKTITFKVIHNKLTKPIMKNVYLKLPAISPLVSEIKARPVQSNENIFLETFISNFAPRNIQVTWYKGWEKIYEGNTSNIKIGENKLCYFKSQIEFSPKALQRGVGQAIRCEVKHPATKSFQEKSFVLNGKEGSLEQLHTSPVRQNHIGRIRSSKPTSKEVAMPMKIECVTSNPKPGEKVTLCCFVPGRSLQGAYVSWYIGIFPVDEEINNKSCEEESGFISYVTITTEKDKKNYEIRCEVCADEETLEETFILETQ